MSRFEIYSELADKMVELSREYHAYETKPRCYGTEDKLYMSEVHHIELIGKLGSTNVKQLVEITQKTKGSVSQIIEKLRKKELVTKRKCEENYREKIIELTEKGMIVYEFHKEVDKREYLNVLEKLGNYKDEELEKISEFISIVVDTHKLRVRISEGDLIENK